MSLSSIDLEIARSLEQDREFRERYLRRWAANEVSAELRGMRHLRKLKQAALAQKAKTGQSAISRIEKQNYDGWTFKTLLTIAIALDARLTIKLEPVEDVIRKFRNHETTDDGHGVIQLPGTTDCADVGVVSQSNADLPIASSGTAKLARQQVM
jgi:transcriptional regulator with XRE-family HTH domain